MALEYKSGKFELKDADPAKGIFTGYASVFGNVDSHQDVIERGAFAKTLGEFAHRVKVLWQHDPYVPIGRPQVMKEDDRGLYVEAKVSQTSMGRDALILLADGVVNELSIGYTRMKEAVDRATGLSHITELKLWEFSPVTWAANDLAIISGVKEMDQLAPLLQRANGLASQLKAGRVLSGQNVKLVQDTITALDAANELLTSLLAAAEAGDGKSTSTSGAPESNIKAADPDAIQSMLATLSQMKTIITKG